VDVVDESTGRVVAQPFDRPKAGARVRPLGHRLHVGGEGRDQGDDRGQDGDSSSPRGPARILDNANTFPDTLITTPAAQRCLAEERQPPTPLLTRPQHGVQPRLPVRITPASYLRAFDAYARAIARVAPGIPLLGPALALPRQHLGWITTLLDGPHPGLRVITVHRYPYSACAAPGQLTYPTIARLLSNQATTGMAATVRSAGQLASHAGLPLRVTELNSVTCGGTLGVSKEAPVGFTAIRLHFALDTDATPEQLETLVKLSKRYCVVYQTLEKSPALTTTAAVEK